MFRIWYQNPRFGRKKQQMWETLKDYFDLVHGNFIFLWEIFFLEESLARFFIWCEMIVYEIGISYLDKWYQVVKLLFLHVHVKKCAYLCH
jgi:hypothetical protein